MTFQVTVITIIVHVFNTMELNVLCFMWWNKLFICISQLVLFIYNSETPHFNRNDSGRIRLPFLISSTLTWSCAINQSSPFHVSLCCSFPTIQSFYWWFVCRTTMLNFILDSLQVSKLHKYIVLLSLQGRAYGGENSKEGSGKWCLPRE